MHHIAVLFNVILLIADVTIADVTWWPTLSAQRGGSFGRTGSGSEFQQSTDRYRNDESKQSLALQSVDVGLPEETNVIASFNPSCPELQGLSTGQSRLCQLYPDHMPAVSRGLRLAIAECQYQLQWRRWNCSTINDSSVFGPLNSIASRETAYLHALLSAGVVHTISRACRDGHLATCGCSRKPRPESLTSLQRMASSTSSSSSSSSSSTSMTSDEMSRDWQWGGCGDNTDYGYKFTQGFVDVKEREKNYPRYSNGLARMLMNIHNNEAGRLAVHHYAKAACKCHGVSGSCNMRTCWHQLPPFREIGDRLTRKYDSAQQVAFNPPGTALIRMLPTPHAPVQGRRRNTPNRRRMERFARPAKEELLYIDLSPDYCEADNQTGSIGTHGRRCERSIEAAATPGSCGMLCCGRGYNSYRTTESERCRCKFQWCCQVKCSLCERHVDIHVCK